MSTLDPHVRWLLSGLRLWFFALSEEPNPDWVLRVSRHSSGRLGVSARVALKWEIEVTPRGLLVGERLVRPRELWSVCRKILVKHVKGIQARRLAEGRPNWYHGLVSFNVKQHLKALSQVDAYQAACYIKIWTGMVMTGARRALMGRVQQNAVVGNPHKPLLTFSGAVLLPLFPPPEFHHLASSPCVSVSCTPIYLKVLMLGTLLSGELA